jgi:RimJ/RimL family protein N-acetyltransferase
VSSVDSAGAHAYPGLPVLATSLQLETPRLLLRQFVEDDLDALATMYADPETMRYMGDGRTFDRGETWRAISGTLGHWLLRGYGMWALVEKETGSMIGRIGFINPEGWPGFELGWTIARSHWGRGYAPEAAAVALRYARETLRQERVISLIRPANAASIRVAEKIGQRHQGSLELFEREALIYAIP